jgi:hypothetical protein
MAQTAANPHYTLNLLPPPPRHWDAGVVNTELIQQGIFPRATPVNRARRVPAANLPAQAENAVRTGTVSGTKGALSTVFNNIIERYVFLHPISGQLLKQPLLSDSGLSSMLPILSLLSRRIFRLMRRNDSTDSKNQVQTVHIPLISIISLMTTITRSSQSSN